MRSTMAQENPLGKEELSLSTQHTYPDNNQNPAYEQRQGVYSTTYGQFQCCCCSKFFDTYHEVWCHLDECEKHNGN